jgi:hypothetical protein
MLAIVGRGGNPSGMITSASSESIALGRAIMAAYAYHRPDEAKLLANKFSSYEELLKTMASIVTEVTGIESWPVF